MTRTSGIWARIILAAGGALALLTVPAVAQQLESFDPDEVYESVPANQAIDADLADPEPTGPISPPISQPVEPVPGPVPVEPRSGPATVVTTSGPEQDSAFDDRFAAYSEDQQAVVAPQWSEQEAVEANDQVASGAAVQTAYVDESTYAKDDLIGAAEGVFGKGAEGLARMIEDLLEKQGQPNGYIVGREAGGAFIFGARYGSGTLHHKVEGQRKVYWTGPSVGFDAGANAGNTFVLVYNLYDTEELFERYPAGEGQAYLVGGLNASYLRKGDVVLIPIRVGAGLRLGVNAGYLKFSKKQRWLPF